MLELHNKRGVRIFLFQDDDFPLWGKAGRRWVDELVDRLHDTGLAQRAVWKISCRAEYVEPELFAKLRDAGLFIVYMGIESGVEQGLETLHKQTSVEQNLTAVQTLKELGIWFSYGFMLLDPSSTFDSIRGNVEFLRQIVGDGYAAAFFCRMLPYGGTPIRDLLEREGRLRGDLTHPDYDFLDVRLNEYYALLKEAARPWIHDEGLSHEFHWAWEELETVRRLVPGVTGIDAYRIDLRSMTAESNLHLFELVEQSSVAFEHGDRAGLSRGASTAVCAEIRERLIARRNQFIADNVQALTNAVDRESIRGPVMVPQVH
jgi:anaerobic magnesium-protoporphyrin IX monomethyl ester cyclase